MTWSLFSTAPGLGSTPARPEFSISDGLFRTLRNERSGRRLITLKLDYTREFKTAHCKHIISALSNIIDSSCDDYEMELVEVKGLLHVPRIVANDALKSLIATSSSPTTSMVMKFGEAGPLKLVIGTVGLLDTLHWVPDSTCYQPLGVDEVDIEVKAIGVNFKDCQVALGRVYGNTFGFECSGVILHAGSESGFSLGERVVVLCNDSFRTVVRSPSSLVCKLPEEISYTQAASLPIQFITAWKSVYDLGRRPHIINDAAKKHSLALACISAHPEEAAVAVAPLQVVGAAQNPLV